MAEITIGELPQASSFNRDSLLISENQGIAESVTGGQIQDLAAAGAADAQRAAEEAADRAAAASVKPPIIGANGNWYLWDFGQDAYVDSGKPSQGAGGNPGQDGQPGADGQDGQDGVSATHSWDGTVLSVTSASGTSSADLQGPAGSDAEVTAENIRAALGYDPISESDIPVTSVNGQTGAVRVAAGVGWAGSGTGAEVFNDSENVASGEYSHSEGYDTTARGPCGHAEGHSTSAGDYSHAEGYGTEASGGCSHAEGYNTAALVNYSHAEGFGTTANGTCSHAEGYGTAAMGDHSHAEGGGTKATGLAQHVQGKFNVEDNSMAHIVGNGTDDENRSNAHTLDWDGNAWFAGEVTVGVNRDKLLTAGDLPESGADGVTFTPYVSLDGVISWTNDGGKTNPDPVDITGPAGPAGPAGADGSPGQDGSDGQPGADGQDGRDGVSATHSWDGTVLTITSASGTSSADLVGPQGPAGADGADGSDATVTKGNIVAALGYTPANAADVISTNPAFGHGYGTCATAESTTTKKVTLSGYKRVAGGRVSVRFTYAVPAGAKMNINNQEAKPMRLGTSAIPAGVIEAGDIATFVYDDASQFYFLTSVLKASGSTVTADSIISALGYTPADDADVQQLYAEKADQSEVDDLKELIENMGEISGGGDTEIPVVSSVDEMTDTSQLYVLEGTGTIWEYQTVTETVEVDNTDMDLLDRSEVALNQNHDGTTRVGAFTTGFIPVDMSSGIEPYIVTMEGSPNHSSSTGFPRVYKIQHYNADKSALGGLLYSAPTSCKSEISGDAYLFYPGLTTDGAKYGWYDDVAYIRVLYMVNNATADITVDDIPNTMAIRTPEPKVTTTTETVSKWVDTGVEPGDGGSANLAGLMLDVLENTKNIEKLDERVAVLEGTVSIPDYWKTAIDAKADLIKGYQSAGASAFQFAWFSDPHGASDFDNSDYSQPTAGTSRVTNIGRVAQYLMDAFDVPLTAISGDIMSQASHSAEDAVWAEFDAMWDTLSPIDLGKLLMVKGNHDGSWFTADGVSYLKNIGDKQIFNALYRKQAADRQRVFGPDGTYFYVDTPQRIRFVMLNSQTDGDGSVDSNGYAVYNAQKNAIFGQTQLDWFADVLGTVPGGWGVVVMGHTQLTLGADGPLVSGMMDAYNQRTTFSNSVTISGDYWGFGVTDATYKNASVNVDFSDASGEVIAYFHGHNHKDIVDTTNYTFPRIVITTAGGDVRDSDPVTRVPGTATETALDLVTVDRDARKIYCTRIGAGSDREISY